MFSYMYILYLTKYSLTPHTYIRTDGMKNGPSGAYIFGNMVHRDTVLKWGNTIRYWGAGYLFPMSGKFHTHLNPVND